MSSLPVAKLTKYLRCGGVRNVVSLCSSANPTAGHGLVFSSGIMGECVHCLEWLVQMLKMSLLNAEQGQFAKARLQSLTYTWASMELDPHWPPSHDNHHTSGGTPNKLPQWGCQNLGALGGSRVWALGSRL